MKALALAVLALFATPALANAECTPVSKVKSDAAARFPGAPIAEMGGDEVKGFLLAFNAKPPVSALTGDYIVMIHLKEKGGRILVIFENGCASKTSSLSDTTFNELMRSL